MIRLAVENVDFAYGARKVLDGVSFEVGEGELLSILGQNGAGKSTLFKCILGLLGGYQGKISVCGKDIYTLSPAEMAKRVAYVPQTHNPPFSFSVLDVVLMGAAHRLRPFASPSDIDKQYALKCLDQMGIQELAYRGYGKLSGGERQLVLLARSLIQQSKIFILDEPTSDLDFGNQMRVLSKIKELTREGYSVIQSTHNPEQAYAFSDNVMVLKNGRVHANGSPKDVITDRMMSEIYGIDIEVESLRGDNARVCLPRNQVV